MNYLAHAFLSFEDGAVLTGNMISDFVKGKTQYQYPPAIQDGIELHRQIDAFTDSHPVTARAKEFFRPVYRLYAGAFTDIVYDHFLALDEKHFAPYGGLLPFTELTYGQLEAHSSFFPERFMRMFPFMRSQNWLYGYRQQDGIRQSFYGLQRRAAYISETDHAFEIFITHYHELQECYDNFFPLLKKYAWESFSKLRG